MRLGVMGGTFDPIHHGHLFIAEEARSVFKLDHVLFVPNGTPPHKREYLLTSAPHRFEMCRIATESNPYFDCDDTEMHRSGPSYAIDSLTELTQRWPDAELFYITGVDAVADILTWRSHKDVMRLATFIAATRPGYDPEVLSVRLPAEYLERILCIESVGLDISSTDIRARLARGLPVRYLLPDKVLEYIVRHRLYSNLKALEATVSAGGA